MFFSLRRLIEDLNIIRFGIGTNSTTPSIGTEENYVRAARFRVLAKLTATMLVIAICVYIINRPDVGQASIKLAFMGFGILIGYWIR